MLAMGLREGLSRIWNAAGGEHPPDGLDELHVGDPAYDDWDIVGDFGDLATGRAFRQSLAERGVDRADIRLAARRVGTRRRLAARAPRRRPDTEEMLDSE